MAMLNNQMVQYNPPKKTQPARVLNDDHMAWQTMIHQQKMGRSTSNEGLASTNPNMLERVNVWKYEEPMVI